MFIALALVACSKPGQSMNADAHLTVVADGTHGTFVCKQSSSGACDFTIFVENCAEPQNPSKPGSGNCMRQVLETFSLNAGDSRVFERLPLGVRYCAKGRGSRDEPICPPSALPVPPKKPQPQTA